MGQKARRIMTPEAYRELRRNIGSQDSVAEKLGVHKQTISNRERGVKPIDREAEYALLYLQNLVWEESRAPHLPGDTE